VGVLISAIGQSYQELHSFVAITRRPDPSRPSRLEKAHCEEQRSSDLLEQRIRDRRLTFEEFIAFAEKFARENGEDGTLSLRHLQCLVTGTTTASRMRPATARLLKRILDENIQELLTPPWCRNADLTNCGSRSQ
jgi:hypothetical protein